MGSLFICNTFLKNYQPSFLNLGCDYILPSQDCCPVRKLYPAVHMHALVVWEVGRHSWEQSPLFLLHRLVPGNTNAQGQICKNKSKVSNAGINRRALHKHSSCSLQIRPSRRQQYEFFFLFFCSTQSSLT